MLLFKELVASYQDSSGKSSLDGSFIPYYLTLFQFFWIHFFCAMIRTGKATRLMSICLFLSAFLDPFAPQSRGYSLVLQGSPKHCHKTQCSGFSDSFAICAPLSFFSKPLSFNLWISCVTHPFGTQKSPSGRGGKSRSVWHDYPLSTKVGITLFDGKF